MIRARFSDPPADHSRGPKMLRIAASGADSWSQCRASWPVRLGLDDAVTPPSQQETQQPDVRPDGRTARTRRRPRRTGLVTHRTKQYARQHGNHIGCTGSMTHATLSHRSAPAAYPSPSGTEPVVWRYSTVDVLGAFIAGMPKAELHLHLEGTLEPELKFELAARNRLELPYGSADEMRAAYGFNNLASFLAVYYEGTSVLLTERDFYDLAMAYFRKARSQNVVYAEVFFDPQAHTARGIPFATVVEGIRRAQQDAEASLGLHTQLIMCFLRDLSAESAMETLEQSLAYREEKNNPPVKFKDVVARARREGYRLTMHCDVDQENSVEHIWQCLDVIRVERIDHGVNALEDEALIREINGRGLGLTVCPISNSYVTGGLKASEIKSLLDAGVRATINSDDPAYFPGYMNENLVAVQRAVPLTREEILHLTRNAFTVSWLSLADRDRYLDALEAYAETAD
jgi:adenosine deaminase